MSFIILEIFVSLSLSAFVSYDSFSSSSSLVRLVVSSLSLEGGGETFSPLLVPVLRLLVFLARDLPVDGLVLLGVLCFHSTVSCFCCLLGNFNRLSSSVVMEIDFESLVEATSGAVGSIVSTTILYPLDTCKTKYQAEVRAAGSQKYRNLLDVLWEAISTRRVLSLYQGLGTKNLQSFIAQFIYFYGYSYFKRLYLRRSNTKTIGTKANLIVAAAAGACTAIITQPLDTAASRMQTSEFGKSKGLWATLTQGSWSEAFDGLGISLLLTSNPSIQYTVFDQLKQRMLKKQEKFTGLAAETPSPQALSAFSAFVLGALSKSIATFVTYPAIRCKVMIQASDPKEGTSERDKAKSKSIKDTLCTIWRKEGPLGFYKGLEAQILKTVLSSALLLMIKEKISKTTWVLMLALRRYLFVVRKRVKNV